MIIVIFVFCLWYSIFTICYKFIFYLGISTCICFIILSIARGLYYRAYILTIVTSCHYHSWRQVQWIRCISRVGIGIYTPIALYSHSPSVQWDNNLRFRTIVFSHISYSGIVFIAHRLSDLVSQREFKLNFLNKSSWAIFICKIVGSYSHTP